MEFSKREIITSSWNIMKPHLSLLILAILFIFGLNLLLSALQEEILGDIKAQSILFTIAAYLFQMGLNLGMLRISLNIINNKEVNFSQLFGSFDVLIPYILATIVLIAILLIAASPGIILLLVSVSADWDSMSNLEAPDDWSVIIPIILIIIPAVYISVRLQFYNYFLLDEETGIIESIKRSAEISKGYVGELFLLGAVLSIIILVSIIPLGLGLLISIPLSTMATSYVYLKLKTTS